MRQVFGIKRLKLAAEFKKSGFLPVYNIDPFDLRCGPYRIIILYGSKKASLSKWDESRALFLHIDISSELSTLPEYIQELIIFNMEAFI